MRGGDPLIGLNQSNMGQLVNKEDYGVVPISSYRAMVFAQCTSLQFLFLSVIIIQPSQLRALTFPDIRVANIDCQIKNLFSYMLSDM